MTLKSCNGCKYLVRLSTLDICRHDDPEITYQTNPYTGRRHQVITGYFRPTTQTMRSNVERCGPDAKFYSPTIFRRFVLFMGSKLK